MWQSKRAERPGRIENTGPENTGPAAPRVAVDEDGLITVAAMDAVALVFIEMATIRERQAEIIQEKLLAVAESCKGRIAVSMAEVGVLTSAGVNALVAVQARCESLGGHLALFALSKDLKRMLKVTKLDRTLVIAENAGEAMRSFSTAPSRRRLFRALSWGRHDKHAA
jgi:anti-anti-sigma factor